MQHLLALLLLPTTNNPHGLHNSLIHSHEFAETFLEVYWLVDGQTGTVLHQRKGCRYTRVPSSVDVGDPFSVTAVNGASSKWPVTALYGAWNLALS